MKKKYSVVDFILVVLATIIVLAIAYGLFCLPYLAVCMCFGFGFNFVEALGWFIIWTLTVGVLAGGKKK